jgi:hypothetical protein
MRILKAVAMGAVAAFGTFWPDRPNPAIRRKIKSVTWRIKMGPGPATRPPTMRYDSVPVVC